MRRVLLLLLAACAEPRSPSPISLDGPHPCGAHTCTSGQVCVIEETGSQCGVNYDAGIGPYDEVSWTCVDLPKECNGVPTCACLNLGPFCDINGRDEHFGCI